jgi:2-aminoethylphosphonate transport system permease protein
MAVEALGAPLASGNKSTTRRLSRSGWLLVPVLVLAALVVYPLILVAI